MASMSMEHLGEQRMMEALFDGVALATVDHDHLSGCPACQQRFATLRLLRDELAVARQSHVRPAAETALFAIFDVARTQDPMTNPLHRLLGTVTEWINALPLWDSRQQASLVGTRGANRSAYRLLFGAQETEVELLVEPHNGFLRVMGEVMVDEGAGRNGLALVELMTSLDAKSAIEAESDVHGRFTLEQIPPGTYIMTITPRYSQMVVIEPLELT